MDEMISLKQFQDYVDEFFEPWRFLASFKTEEEFAEWLDLGSIDDLQNLMGVFHEFEWATDLVLESINRKTTHPETL